MLLKIESFAIIFFVFRLIESGCPDRWLIYPCTCHHSIFGTHIYCGGNSRINLDNIFDSMSIGLETEKKHFTHLTLANTAFNQLNENVFRDITFEAILIENCLNLTKIHKNAFTDTNWLTKSFSIRNCLNLKTDINEFFESMSKFKNLENLEIIDTNISEIPSNAFKPINGYQNQLKNISITGKYFQMIGNNSFRYLNSLINLNFVNTSIDLIPDYAFAFSRPSKFKLHINLVNNTLLNENSFSKNSFGYIYRPTQLSGITATILFEETFLPFLLASDQNMLKMSNKSQLDCNDCRNFWLRTNSQLLLRVTQNKCSNHENLMDNNNFIHCIH